MQKCKKAIRYLKKNGPLQTMRHAWNRVQLSRIQKADLQRENAPEEKNVLSVYEYKYYRFLQRRKKQFCIDFSQIHVPQTEGLVSIVMPVCSGEEQISESILSVLRQTYRSFELMIINHGSNARTSGIIDAWAQKDERITVIHQNGQTPAHALNSGFSLARGEFLTWLSADTSMHPECLAKLVGFMKKRPELAMCYAGACANNSGRSSHNPHAQLRLNTYPDNLISGPILYRRAVPLLIGGYDTHLQTVADYDYWMRINNFLSLEQADFEVDQSPVSKSRKQHSDEVLAPLLLMEDFREDWLIRPMCWIISGEGRTQRWREAIVSAGHIEYPYDAAMQLSWPGLGTGVVQVTLAQNGSCPQPKPKTAQDAMRILVCEGTVRPENADAFDLLIQIGKGREEIPAGWIRAENEKAAFDLIQIFCKARWFDAMSVRNRMQEKLEKKATIVLCTYKRMDAVRHALESMIGQNMPKHTYEILVVNNAPQCSEVRQLVETLQDGEHCLRYIDCPYPGLSYARNFSLYAARGEIILFVDDDGIMQADCLKKLADAFDSHPDAAVIGGQILLKCPEQYHSVILPGYEALWSERKFDKKAYFEATQEGDFPYGCNYAIRRDTLRMLGGFRVTYGRVGKDFSGGEEMILSHLVRRIGRKIGIEPLAVVTHDVEASRYTLEHVRQTLRASRLTSRLLKLDLYRPFDRQMQEERFLLRMMQQRQRQLLREGVSETDLKYLYCRFELEALQEAIEAGERDNAIMKRECRRKVV